jgi:transglutaminase-like putative cysteine protease
VWPKDYLSEILAIRYWVAEHVSYKNDPLTVETVSDPQRVIEEIARYGKAKADCDDGATLMSTLFRQCGREVELVTVGFGRPNKYSHVFTRVQEPRTKRWIVCDPVAGTKESTMLSRVTTWKAWRIP